MPQTRVRVAGSGFTTLAYNGTPIMWLDGFNDRGQAPIVRPEPITPLGDRWPREIATTRTLDMGVITATIRELWNMPVWWMLGTGDENTPGMFANSTNLIDVYERIAASGEVTCTMAIRDPADRSRILRGKVYHGCIVTGIDDGENIQVASLSVPRNIEISYRYTTRL